MNAQMRRIITVGHCGLSRDQLGEFIKLCRQRHWRVCEDHENADEVVVTGKAATNEQIDAAISAGRRTVDFGGFIVECLKPNPFGWPTIGEESLAVHAPKWRQLSPQQLRLATALMALLLVIGGAVAVVSALSSPVRTYAATPDGHIFHRPDCPSLRSAKKIELTTDYNTLIQSGKRPCKICHPELNR